MPQLSRKNHSRKEKITNALAPTVRMQWGIKNRETEKNALTPPKTPHHANPIIIEPMQNTGDQRYIWNIDLGALTGLPQSMT